ncbi:MAG TPA: hypothetical protein VFP61_03720 [Acidimicrobiales bacterium]|nr:hypothetical protein [Acidimicrobiales bacterium]
MRHPDDLPTPHGGQRRAAARAARLFAVAAVTSGLVLGAGAAHAATVAQLAWTEPATPTSPSPLRDPAMAYDPDTGEVVLFGGVLPGGTPSDQTWEWNGTKWLQPPVAGAVPPARSGAALAFDGVHHQFLLFGGLDSAGRGLNDTWAWNGASWVQLATAADAVRPPASFGGALAANPGDMGGLVLVGGTIPPATASAPAATTTAPPASPVAPGPSLVTDTYTWTGTAWVDQGPSGPPPRTGAALALDPVHRQTVLFGGSPAPAGTTPAAAPLADTWTWNGSAWSQAAPATSPPGRAGAQLVGDPQTGGLVLAGGDLGGSVAADTWGWDGATWEALAPSGPPPARRDAGAAFDVATAAAVLYGGVDQSGAALASTAVLAAQATRPASPTTATTAPPTTGAARQVAPSVSTAAVSQQARPPSTTPPAGPPATSPPSSVPAAVDVLPAVTTALPRPPAPAVVRPGDQVVLLGAGFRPGATVAITLHPATERIGSTTATASGQVSTAVAVPPSVTPGRHRFELSGPGADGAPVDLYTDVDVLAPASTGGADVQTPVLLAIALVLPLLTWLVLSVRSRRAARPTA